MLQPLLSILHLDKFNSFHSLLGDRNNNIANVHRLLTDRLLLLRSIICPSNILSTDDKISQSASAEQAKYEDI